MTKTKMCPTCGRHPRAHCVCINGALPKPPITDAELLAELQAPPAPMSPEHVFVRYLRLADADNLREELRVANLPDYQLGIIREILNQIGAPFRVEVIADSSGQYCGNGLTFATVELASEYARDLFARWTLVRAWRVVDANGKTVAGKD